MHVQSWINAGYLEYTTTTMSVEAEVEDLGGLLGHELLVLFPEGVHTVDHLLHQLNLRQERLVQVKRIKY